jgi:hypothetical protein
MGPTSINLRRNCWHSLMTSFWCNANARVEVVSYFCVAVNLFASYSCALVSLLLTMCIAFFLYMDCIWVNTSFTHQCGKMHACHCTSLIQSFIWKSSACDMETYVTGIWIVSTSSFRGNALIMWYTKPQTYIMQLKSCTQFLHSNTCLGVHFSWTWSLSMLGQHLVLVTLFQGLHLVLSKTINFGDTKYNI